MSTRAAPLICSECGKKLPPGSKTTRRTCSDKCRAERSRRFREGHARAQEEALEEVQVTTTAQKAMGRAITANIDDRIHKVLDRELGPIVREHITEDVQRSIAALLGMMPLAVKAIMEDLSQGDSYDRRQKAYTLLMKYTAGHPKLITDADPAPAAINVVFAGMERPEQTAIEASSEVVQDGEFVCNGCGEVKPDAARVVAGAERCQGCHQALQDRRDEILREKGAT